MTAALFVIAAAVAAPAWWTADHLRRWLLPAIAAVAVAAAAIVASATSLPGLPDAVGDGAVVVAGALAAIAVGGPLTVAVLHAAAARTDANEPGRHEATRTEPLGDAESAASVLRGGAWIGALERVAVLATLVAGWPEGLAVVLAVKGLGRYPELRHPGAAERFIIGTFSSVLWAAACAAVVITATS